jgi:hypothetical protein
MALKEIDDSSTGKNYNNLLLFVVFAIAAAIMIDISIIRHYIIVESSSNVSIYVFIIISAIFIAGQYYLLKFARYNNIKSVRSKKISSFLDPIGRAMKVFQYVLMAILVFIILQIFLTSHFNSFPIILAALLSYSLAILVMTIMSRKFFLWFKSNRDYRILLYGLSSATLCANALLTLVLVIILTPNQPTDLRSHAGVYRLFSTSDEVVETLNNLVTASSIISFSITWFATALLLRQRSRSQLGKVLYWVIMSIPLIYFLGQFLILFINPFPVFGSDAVNVAVFLVLAFALSKPVGGILFGTAFFSAARKVTESSIKKYLLIAASGFMLFFMSNQAAFVLQFISYPPFGFPTILLTGLSSYLIMVGIYSSAIFLSQDAMIRKSIKKLAAEETRLIESISWAQLERETQDKIMFVIKASQNKIDAETGIEPPSMSEDEVREYMDEVLRELKPK